MTTIANVDMAEAWDGPEGDHWTEQADRYESIGLDFADALFAALSLERGERVLDVGCGTGRSTRDAGRLVTAGSAHGVDLSSRMLDRARAKAADEGLANVTFEQADAQVHPFEDGAFDAAMSSFGAMFFGDPVAAFTNVGRALRPTGRLGLLAWRELSANEWLSSLRSALAAGRDLPSPPPGAPGPFGLADEKSTRELLAGAGFADVEIEAVDAPMRFGADARDAFAFVSTLGITRGLLHDLDDEAASAATAAVQRMIAEHEGPSGVTFGGAAWLITARVASGAGEP